MLLVKCARFAVVLKSAAANVILIQNYYLVFAEAKIVVAKVLVCRRCKFWFTTLSLQLQTCPDFAGPVFEAA